MSSRVIHYRDRKHVHDLAYVGRAVPRLGLPESPFANRYRIGQDGSRFDVIQKYRSWILGQPELLQRLYELRGRPLACWCAPEPCHADVLVELVDADAVLDELHAASVNVEVREGRLHLRPASSVDQSLLARVKATKPAILDLLATRSPLPDAEELWRQAVERIADSCRVPDDVLADLRRARVKWR